MTDNTDWPRRGQLISIDVAGLFGRKDVFVPVNQAIPTVLTGANGSGKSTILRLVHAAAKLDLDNLFTHSFSRLTLNFEAGDSLIVERESLSAAFIHWRGSVHPYTPNEYYSKLPRPAQLLLQEVGFDAARAIEALAEGGSRLFSNFSDYRQSRTILSDMEGKEFQRLVPDWLKKFTEYFQVDYISDKRLHELLKPNDSQFRDFNQNNASAISGAANYIGQLLTRAEATFGRRTERMDQLLPKMVVTAMKSDSEPTAEDVANLAHRVATRRESLRSVGLLEVGGESEDGLVAESTDSPAVRQVVAAILESMLTRLDQLEAEETRLSAFKNFLDRRLHNKSVVFGGRRGMVFKTPSREIVRPDQLSSGEQHLVILAFDILFATKRESLVIIDEPEISLHVAWQDYLLGDFMKLGEGQGLRFLMASHAPTIVASMPDCEWPIEGSI